MQRTIHPAGTGQAHPGVWVTRRAETRLATKDAAPWSLSKP